MSGGGKGHFRCGRAAVEYLKVSPNCLCSPYCVSILENVQTESPNVTWASLFLFLSLLV